MSLRTDGEEYSMEANRRFVVYSLVREASTCSMCVSYLIHTHVIRIHKKEMFRVQLLFQ